MSKGGGAFYLTWLDIKKPQAVRLAVFYLVAYGSS